VVLYNASEPSFRLMSHVPLPFTRVEVFPSIAQSGADDFSPELTYVAISRIRSLRGLLFEEPFSYQRIKTKP
jgi:hypothetical protein